ncbi:hypothetical protein PM8797T_21238 [Gimesia maris DSM 8797]|nr:hypothetical protein PM8797T_21238 [Gimesia maris DSM 8797]
MQEQFDLSLFSHPEYGSQTAPALDHSR